MKIIVFLLLISNCYCTHIKHIGSRDITAKVKRAIKNPKVNVIKIEKSGSEDIILSGIIDCENKVLSIEQGTTINGDATIKNAILEAHKEQVLFSTSINLENVASTTGVFYSSWYGANGFDNTADDVELQKALDYIVSNDAGLKAFEFSPGTYRLNKGLVIWRDNDKNGDPEQVNIRISGMIGAYMGTSNEVRLLCNFSNGFGIAIQKGKGVIIENLNIEGQNILNYPIEKALDPVTTYLANDSMRTNSKSPYAGLVIDFAGSSVESQDRYPGFENYYPGVLGNGGSTDCKFYNVSVSGFVAGIILSPNTNTQNNEAHTFDGIWINNCRDGFVTTNSQERTVQCKNFKFWNSVKTCFRTNTYGINRGEVPQIESMNAAGVYELFNFSGIGGYFPVIAINNCYAENFYWIGIIHGISVQFNGCHFAFALMPGINKKTPDYIANGSSMMFFNCILISYGDKQVPYNIRGRTKFVNCYLQNPIAYSTQNWTVDFYEVEYENCQFYSQEGFISDNSFESLYSNYFSMGYGSQAELATYNKEYASFKAPSPNFSQYRKVKSPTVERTLLSNAASVTVNGNKAVCSISVAAGIIIYANIIINGVAGHASMVATSKPYEFDHVINSMVSGTYILHYIHTNTIGLVGFVSGGNEYRERGEVWPNSGPNGSIVSNYLYDEWGFSDQNPATSPYVPAGVAFTKGAIYTNQTGSGSSPVAWICSKSGVKGSALVPEFKQLVK